LRENLLMALAEHPVGFFEPFYLRETVVHIVPGRFISQGRKIHQPAEDSGDLV